ncbi:hypothetical protein SCP_0200750 [Sparassis crispa]|uniref:Uncharacterized protein n=1 Tax=Sparassis crispa TaxID=139825 RepID=A0A401G9N9_9APHY|nr:hypothetical protein SCP_0200750 [Sparassis crispa]GBE78878.1 hypothetical protein SCP_0200750 [Sparassis crispa]
MVLHRDAPTSAQVGKWGSQEGLGTKSDSPSQPHQPLPLSFAQPENAQSARPLFQYRASSPGLRRVVSISTISPIYDETSACARDDRSTIARTDAKLKKAAQSPTGPRSRTLALTQGARTAEHAQVSAPPF